MARDDGAHVARSGRRRASSHPSPLRSYTGAAEVGVAVPLLAPELPPTVGGVLATLDLDYPGIRFRIIDEQGKVRPHVKLFVGPDATRDLRVDDSVGSDVDDRRCACQAAD